jgi:hypothetical protein
MNFSLEKKYLQLAGVKIKNESKSDINVSCPICREGKSKWRARGYVLKKAGDETAVYHCHNECGSMSFYQMLKYVDLSLASGYLNEIKKDKLRNFKKTELDVFDLTSTIIEEIKIPSLITIDGNSYSLDPLNDTALEYLLNQRNLLENQLYQFRYITTLNAICCLFLTNENLLYGYQLRYLDEKIFNIHLYGNNPKIWNLYHIDLSKPIYVFESIFDALSSGLENVISILGADISADAIKTYLPNADLVFCLDNDSPGVQKAIKYSKLGFRILVHSDEFPVKDFNKALELGASRLQIQKYILSHVMTPKLANMKLRLNH